MGCCSSNNREVVNEMEEKVNQKGTETLPIKIKILFILVIACGITAYLYI